MELGFKLYSRPLEMMDPLDLQRLLDSVREGKTTTSEAMRRLRHLPFEDKGYAKIDHHRHLRQGFPEVILAEGKSSQQVVGIAESLLSNSKNLLITRASPEVFESIQNHVPQAVYHPSSRCIVVRRDEGQYGRGKIAVVSAGTSDIPVAEEAVVTATIMGNRVEPLYDLGVAGLHRILQHREQIDEANVLIVVAGMEGALPSVVAGMVSVPVIAVPTSVGYGASFNGLAALLGMLNSCASNVTVVNIDNGFGAGYVASLINRK